MIVAADMQLFNVDVIVFSTNYGSSHMASSSCMRFVSHVSLKVARKPTIETGLLGSKKCSSISDLTFFTMLVL